MPNPKSQPDLGPVHFGPKELYDYVMFQLGLDPKSKCKLWPYKIWGRALVLSPVDQSDKIIELGGEAA